MARTLCKALQITFLALAGLVIGRDAAVDGNALSHLNPLDYLVEDSDYQTVYGCYGSAFSERAQHPRPPVAWRTLFPHSRSPLLRLWR